MAGVTRYSGIVAKVHAMNPRLLNEEQYDELIRKRTVLEALEYLKTLPGYADSFDDEFAKNSHRDAIERRLMDSLYTDFIKLYRFCGMKERAFLEGYFIYFEANIVKVCLRNVMNTASADVYLGSFDEFFHKHSKLSIDALNNCDTLEEFMAAVEGSAYERILTPIYTSGSRRLSDYEIALDLYFFTSIWKIKKTKLSDEEAKDISATLGTRIDMLNIQWIYRCKAHFKMAEADIYPMLIPIYYKLKPNDIKALAASASEDEFKHELDTTYYSKWDLSKDLSHLSTITGQLLGHIYRLKSRKHPYSIATPDYYLYRKEREINCLIPIIEGIRYGLSPQELRKSIPAEYQARRF